MRDTHDIQRPVIFDFEDHGAFIKAMLAYRKATDEHFSVRSATQYLQSCSPSLVTRVANGKRPITRDRVEDFARLLELRTEEKTYLDNWVKLSRRPAVTVKPKEINRRRSAPSNHILSDWLNVYVKDAIRLKGFRPDPLNIHRLLGGIASVAHIRKALSFLLREGFFKRHQDGSVTKPDLVTVTTDEIPDAKISAFHKQALEIAKRNIDLFPLEKRRESAMILPVNGDSLPELKELLKEFQERLIEFAETHSEDDEQLYQILINLSPIGGQS